MNKGQQIKLLKNKIASLEREKTLLQSKASKEDNFENLLNAIIDSIAGIHWCKDTKGVYQGCNSAMVKALGLSSRDDIIGKTDYELPWAKQAHTLLKHDKIVMDTGMTQKGKEEIVETKQGDVRTFIVAKAPIRDQLNNIIGTVGNSIDVTELKQTQKALKIAKEAAEAASQAKTDFLENMRHDIRTPLGGIVGCARIIQSKPNDSEKVSEYATDIIQSSEALLNFLNRILEGIKVATGEMPLLKKKFDFRKNIQTLLELNQSLAAKKKLRLTLDIDNNVPAYLVGDSIRLQRIVLELMTNALRFTQQGSIDVEIKLKKREAQWVVVEIKVSDTGIGIPADKQDEIFTRFIRLTPSHQGIYKGLGLGLSIVKQFIDDFGGEIYVKSQLKQGSTFTCFIPFQVPLVMDNIGVEDIPLSIENALYTNKNSLETIPKAAQAHHNLNANQRKILLVEDDLLAAKIAQIILVELNCATDLASDAKTALQQVQKQNYHLILMDIGLPDMDGITLTHRIRLQQWQQDTTPIIGLTAHIGVERRQKCLDAGMNAVMLKPLKKETALELLTTFSPDVDINQSSTPDKIRPVTGPVLDVEAMKSLLKNEALIKDCFNLLIVGLENDLIKLPELHQAANWQAIREIAHKLQGGASYCGTERLERACKQLVDYLGEKGSNGPVNALYQQLLQEMETTKAVCEDYT